MSKKIRYVPRKISHHGIYSGYHILFEYMSIKSAANRLLLKLTRLIPKFIAWRLYAMRPQESAGQGLAAEISAMLWVIVGRGRICHFIYGEDTYFFTPLWKNGKNQVIASFHYPPNRLRERVSPGAVKSLDAVIIVGTNQREYFEAFLPSHNIYFVPHHVNSDYFTPKENNKDQTSAKRGIFVGNCMRDFDTLWRVLTELNRLKIDIIFDLLIPFDLHKKFADLPNAKCHSGVSDGEMLELYQSVSLGIMPMTDCTANNSVLEMMSCGLPVIVSNVGGIHDYLDEQGGRFVPQGNIVHFVKEIVEMINDAEVLMTKGAYNRKRVVKEFSLNAVSKKMSHVYGLIGG